MCGLRIVCLASHKLHEVHHHNHRLNTRPQNNTRYNRALRTSPHIVYSRVVVVVLCVVRHHQADQHNSHLTVCETVRIWYGAKQMRASASNIMCIMCVSYSRIPGCYIHIINIPDTSDMVGQNLYLIPEGLCLLECVGGTSSGDIICRYAQAILIMLCEHGQYLKEYLLCKSRKLLRYYRKVLLLEMINFVKYKYS